VAAIVPVDRSCYRLLIVKQVRGSLGSKNEKGREEIFYKNSA
jgi:hypothetical protein